MIKLVELIIIVILLVFSFLGGVKYSDGVKSHVSWLFENKEEEIELPDLSNENAVEITAPTEGANSAVDDSGNVDANKPVDPNQAPANQAPVADTSATAPASNNAQAPSAPASGNQQLKIDLEPKKQ